MFASVDYREDVASHFAERLALREGIVWTEYAAFQEAPSGFGQDARGEHRLPANYFATALNTGGDTNYQIGTIFTPTLTGNAAVDALQSGTGWSMSVINYAFATSKSDYPGSYGSNEPNKSFEVATVEFQQAVRYILEGHSGQVGGYAYLYGSAESFLLVNFQETTPANGVIMVASSSAPGTAWGYYPWTDAEAGDVWFNNAYAGSRDVGYPKAGDYNWLTAIHELGHTLGLKHGHETDGLTGAAVPLAMDDLEFTVMSYRSYILASTSGGYANETWGYPTTYMMLDIAALQEMYGADFTTNATDTTYTWNPNSGEMSINGVGQGAPGANRIFMTTWDGGGNDTYDFSNYTGAGVTVSLAAGGYSTASAAQLANLGDGNFARGNIFNALLYHGDVRSLIENAIGTQSNDVLVGNQAANWLQGLGGSDHLDGGEGADILEGGVGNDTLIGGLGIDKADYRNATSAVTVNLSVLTAQSTGSAGMDTISGVEDILGSAFNDVLTGDAGSNSLQGKAGNDQLNGGDGGDTLVGGAGADLLNGGAGLDYASYGDALTGVGLNLTTGSHTGDAAGDTFVAIERYRLSSFADTFTGSAAGNYAYGNDGNDTLSGAGGVDKLYGQNNADTLNGDAGNDILIGGAGADIFNGGADRDTASYEDMTQAIRLDLTGATSTLDAIGDVFNSIEIFWLTAFNDTFVGAGADDEVRGWDGADTLNGGDGSDRLRGENGNDVLNGGEGDDFLWGDAGTDTLNGGNGTDTLSYTYARTAGVSINLTSGVKTGEAAGDTYVSIERFQLTNQSTLADSFTGSAGNDWVAGYKGADTLNGLDGNDTLNGGEHNDVIDGGNGADKLIAGTGNDTLTGGTGADQFWFDVGHFGNDTVTDFEDGVDKLRITKQPGIDSIGDLTISQQWANVLITLPDGSTITLNGTTTGEIDASDFLWT
jgi:serralysin